MPSITHYLYPLISEEKVEPKWPRHANPLLQVPLQSTRAQRKPRGEGNPRGEGKPRGEPKPNVGP